MFCFPSSRTWFGILALSSTVACGAQSSEICNQYLACVGATSPATLSESLNVYGRDGTCWKTLAANLCEQICRDTPDQPAQASQPAQCPARIRQHRARGLTAEWRHHGRSGTADVCRPFEAKTMYYGGAYTELPPGRDRSRLWHVGLSA